MTAWVTIPDSDIDPDSPITTPLMTALRDNVAASFEKASGAPVLANNYLVGAMFSKTSTYSTQAVAGSGTWTPTVGVYMIRMSTSNLVLQMWTGSAWTSYSTDAAFIITNGSEFRVNNTTGTSYNVYYRKLD